MLWREEIKWLRDFADGLRGVFMHNQEVRKTLKGLFFVLNKIDLVDPNKAAVQQQEVREALKEVLEPALGKKPFERIEVLTCSLYDERTTNEVVLSMFSAFHENKSLV